MGLESGTFISDLNATNPTSADAKSQGDDHLRLIKSTLKNTFPNVTGAVTATHTELSSVATKAFKTGDTYTGTHNFTGAVVTVPTVATNNNSVSAASTAYVQNALLNAALSPGVLPAQSGQAGEFLQTNGTSVSWEPVFASQTGNAGRLLTTDGTQTSWTAIKTVNGVTVLGAGDVDTNNYTVLATTYQAAGVI